MKPEYLGLGEWLYCECYIQLQEHPKLKKYHVFEDSEGQDTIGTYHTFKEAKEAAKNLLTNKKTNKKQKQK